MARSQNIRLGLAIARLGLMVSAAFAVVRLASAEIDFNRDTVPAVRLAVEIGSGQYWERLGDLEPNHARHWLKEATRVDPHNSAAWISWGLAEERDGDFTAARTAFDRAFFLDRQYGPAWALANFCLRHGDQDCFWRAAARAALRSPSFADLAIADSGGRSAGTSLNLTDLAPLLDLAGRMEASPSKALDHLVASIDRFAAADGAGASYARSIGKELEKAWLNDLIDQERWEDAAIIARRVESRHDMADTTRLDDLVDRLIVAGKASEAIDTWNKYAGFASLAPYKGPTLTNGDFAREPREVGFDWRLGLHQPASSEESRQIAKHWQPNLMEFRLSGDQPEQVELAAQRLPVAPRTYRLRFEYLTRAIASSTGIRWEFVTKVKGRDHRIESEPLGPSEQWRSAQWTFSNASTIPLALGRLRLIYLREPGSGRVHGLFSLRRVSLETL